ncbi:MAG TPA: hypothetical protein VMH39_03235 [Gemmatimonadaceae bacterium]|nr:hypothetical protein [Gemmatimonadaceae bacterium]
MAARVLVRGGSAVDAFSLFRLLVLLAFRLPRTADQRKVGAWTTLLVAAERRMRRGPSGRERSDESRVARAVVSVAPIASAVPIVGVAP